MSLLATRLSDVRSKVERAAQAAGRSPNDVTLIAVSKFHPVDALVEAHALGVRDFGENIVQELADKASAMADKGLDVRWHFIGRLQSNKINMLLRHRIFRVATVGSTDLADALAKRAPPDGLDVLIQVNIGREQQKGGVAPEETEALAKHILAIEQLRLKGLMAIPPAEHDAGPFFDEMRKLSQKVQTFAPDARELSLGMTSDFASAIAHGSTHVRIGTAIFGERQS
jgi:pyridoxal phosphate enzyme (YggS family)